MRSSTFKFLFILAFCVKSATAAVVVVPTPGLNVTSPGGSYTSFGDDRSNVSLVPVTVGGFESTFTFVNRQYFVNSTTTNLNTFVIGQGGDVTITLQTPFAFITLPAQSAGDVLGLATFVPDFTFGTGTRILTLGSASSGQSAGFWVDSLTHYLGFAVDAGPDKYYGYFQLSVKNAASSPVISVDGYAIESTANQAISIAPIPEPSIYSTLMTTVLLGVRSRKKSRMRNEFPRVQPPHAVTCEYKSLS